MGEWLCGLRYDGRRHGNASASNSLGVEPGLGGLNSLRGFPVTYRLKFETFSVMINIG